MRNLLAVAVLLIAACAHTTPPDTMRAELLAMRDADQEVRRRWLKDQQNPAFKNEMAALSATHVARVRAFIRELGTWPGKSIVGQDGSSAAWTIIQHAPAAVIHELLPMMERAAEKDELSYALVATTIDRDLIHQGRKQRYGTQFDTSGDQCEPKPLEDPERVEELRKRAGLGPLSEYAEMLCKLYKQPQK
jgi:hypothetical protein